MSDFTKLHYSSAFITYLTHHKVDFWSFIQHGLSGKCSQLFFSSRPKTNWFIYSYFLPPLSVDGIAEIYGIKLHDLWSRWKVVSKIKDLGATDVCISLKNTFLSFRVKNQLKLKNDYKLGLYSLIDGFLMSSRSLRLTNNFSNLKIISSIRLFLKLCCKVLKVLVRLLTEV